MVVAVGSFFFGATPLSSSFVLLFSVKTFDWIHRYLLFTDSSHRVERSENNDQKTGGSRPTEGEEQTGEKRNMSPEVEGQAKGLDKLEEEEEEEEEDEGKEGEKEEDGEAEMIVHDQPYLVLRTTSAPWRQLTRPRSATPRMGRCEGECSDREEERETESESESESESDYSTESEYNEEDDVVEASSDDRRDGNGRGVQFIPLDSAPSSSTAPLCTTLINYNAHIGPIMQENPSSLGNDITGHRKRTSEAEEEVEEGSTDDEGSCHRAWAGNGRLRTGSRVITPRGIKTSASSFSSSSLPSSAPSSVVQFSESEGNSTGESDHCTDDETTTESESESEDDDNDDDDDDDDDDDEIVRLAISFDESREGERIRRVLIPGSGQPLSHSPTICSSSSSSLCFSSPPCPTSSSSSAFASSSRLHLMTTPPLQLSLCVKGVGLRNVQAGDGTVSRAQLESLAAPRNDLLAI